MFSLTATLDIKLRLNLIIYNVVRCEGLQNCDNVLFMLNMLLFGRNVMTNSCGGSGFSEPGRCSRSVEEPRGMTDTYYK
jgi:hypothetical protein